jgi:hypothetical protein
MPKILNFEATLRPEVTMNVRHTLFALLLSLLPSAVSAQSQANCTFLTFAPPSGDTLLEVNGISSSGVIVGGLEDNSTLHNSGFIRNANGLVTTYNVASSVSTNFTGRNDAAVNIGIYADTSTGASHGFFLQGSHFGVVNYPTATNTFLNGINKGDVMVGGFVAASGNDGFELASGKFMLLRFPGALNTSAKGISDQGLIVGEYDFNGANLHGFILRNGAYQTVDDPDKNNAFGTVLYGINNSGVAVGAYEDFEAFFHGFIYKNGGFSNVVYPGSRNTFVQGINNAGIITGLAFFAEGSSKGFAASCQ